MLIVNNKRYVKRHLIGGSGIFDTVANLFKRLTGSTIAKSITSNLARAAASDLGKTAISAAKTAGKELATSAISTAKDIAIDRGKRLIDTTSAKLLTPKNAEIIKQLTGLEPNTPVITQKSKDILTGLINSGASGASANISKILMGQGINNAIRIQDLVKQMNGGGLRLA